ncbi:MAG: DUF177 domain-containing protein [Chloroflexota bacterium]|nr:DUF177 domain-containing protein [Chloroflexota bacterium]
MAAKTQTIENDTTIHVAQFLQEPVGATRQARILLDSLPLDDDAAARGVKADVRLTRIPAGILAAGQVDAAVTVQCIRCLEDFEQQTGAEFADEYRPTVDILTGVDVSVTEDGEDEADYFTIGGAHVLDLRESLRQALILGLPMAPLCREDCPGLAEELDGAGESGDGRLAVLGQLLDAGAGNGAADPDLDTQTERDLNDGRAGARQRGAR